MAIIVHLPMATAAVVTVIPVMDIIVLGGIVMGISGREAIVAADIVGVGSVSSAIERCLMAVNVQMARKVISVLALVVPLSAVDLRVPLAAGPFDNMDAAYQRGEYETTLQLLRPLVDKGSAGAELRLGLMYFDGRGVPQDYSEAAKWYRKAAENGDIAAQSYLGFMYLKGQGVPQNYSEALKWARPAADRGNARAQYILGLMYEHGDGVGLDYFQAHVWLNLAAAGFTEAEADLYYGAVSDRNSVALKMTQAQVTEAQRFAHEWKVK
jgi:TPR repeat protein